jgi:hypothetical protein
MIGTHSVTDHWSPFGTADMLEKVDLCAQLYAGVDEFSLSRAMTIATGDILPLNDQGEQVWPETVPSSCWLRPPARPKPSPAARPAPRASTMVASPVVRSARPELGSSASALSGNALPQVGPRNAGVRSVKPNTLRLRSRTCRTCSRDACLYAARSGGTCRPGAGTALSPDLSFDLARDRLSGIALLLTEDRPRSRVSGVGRAHAGNIGLLLRP